MPGQTRCPATDEQGSAALAYAILTTITLDGAQAMFNWMTAKWGVQAVGGVGPLVHRYFDSPEDREEALSRLAELAGDLIQPTDAGDV